MNKAWKIFLRDLFRLRKNFIAIVVLAGICIIPSLYAWFNIYANMDPYANTGNLQIAVVNMDAGTNHERIGRLDVGDALEEKLRNNDQLGWNFTDEETALNGVKSGDYYAAIIIPESFSKDLASVFSTNPHQPEIIFYSNEKKNAIAPKITGSGVSSLQQGINDEFVAAVSESMVSILQDKIGQTGNDLDRSMSDLKEGLRATSDLTEDFVVLLDEFHAIKEDSDRLLADGQSALSQASDMADNAAESVEDIEDRVSASWEDIRDFSEKARTGIANTDQKLSELNDSAGTKLGTLDSKIREVDQELNDKVSPVVSRVKSIQELNADIIDTLTDINEAYPNETIAGILSDLKEDNQRHQQILSALESASAGAADLYDFSSNAYPVLSEGIRNSQNTLQDSISTLDASLMTEAGISLSEASSATGHLQGLNETVQTDIEGLSVLLDDMGETIDSTDTALTETQETLGLIRDQLEQARADLNAIESLQIFTDLKNVSDGLDSEQISRFMSSPVSMETELLYPVKNYGTGMTPFFTNLAIWVGCLILVNIFKSGVDEDEKLNNLKLHEVYFGRWFLFIFTALIQAFIVCAGDLWLLHIPCVHPVLFILSGLWISFVFMNLIYAFVMTFKHVGKALCVLFVILQIPGSSGTYPIEMTPKFFQNLHPFLPFTYGVGAMRETIAGIYPHHFAANMSLLLIFLPVAFVIGLALRPAFWNLNALFDHRLAETDLIATEKGGAIRERKSFGQAARALFADPETKQLLLARIDRFEQRYQKIVRRSFLLIVIIPVIFLILMFAIPAKMVFLILWIASMLFIVLFLLIVEYFREHLDRRRRIAEMTADELIKTMQDNDKEHTES